MTQLSIGITASVAAEVCALLNPILANEFILSIKTLNFHWHIEGQDFYAQHLFFEKQYKELLAIIDDIAERIRSLNHHAIASCVEFLKYTTLKESNGDVIPTRNMLEQLLFDHETIIQQIRAALPKIIHFGDEGTANFMTDIMEKHEKTAWMLRASV
jgi:starvation-inducible DNA-binding protein